MGKIRSNKEVRKKAVIKSTGSRSNELKNTVGKLESEIGAISLGPPRSKILKKSASSSPGLLTANFASRAQLLNKQKKKVRFCQNLVAEELKEQKASTSSSSENAKHYFKVIHPSAIVKKNAAGFKSAAESKSSAAVRILDTIDSEVLLSNSSRALRNIIKSSSKNKKTIQKARRESFRKKLELLKTKRIELEKAKQRQQTVIVGDLHPILQALPPLTSNDDDVLETDLLARKGTPEDNKPKINKNKFSVKKRQQAILDSLNFFETSGVTTGLSSTT